MTTTTGKYIPRPADLHDAFYAEFASAGRLRVQSCDHCGACQHPPRYRCGRCGATELSWADCGATGRIVSWTATHRPVDPGWAGEVPYVTLIVEVADGVRIVGACCGFEARDLRIGLPVAVTVEPVNADFARIVFEPVPSENLADV